MDKNSTYVDGLGDLYRASLFILRRNNNTAKLFLLKAKSKLDKKFDEKLLVRPTDHRIWAEKVLDCYTRLKIAQ